METRARAPKHAPKHAAGRLLVGLSAGGAGAFTVSIWKLGSIAISLAFHLSLGAFALLPGFAAFLDSDDAPMSTRRFEFDVAGGEGLGGGGGGGGSGGNRITAYIPERVEPAPEPEAESERQAPIAPRKPRPLRFEDLENLEDDPDQTASLLGNVFSPQAVDAPGLSLTDFEDYGGRDTERSAGTGGGIGGGDGIGVGEGRGWGVGPGYGGGSGGGAYSPGGYDIEPRIIFEPDKPPYPEAARRRRITAEVMLQILVKLDGSTEVLGVIKSGCRVCVETAREHARKYRWKPALKGGRPVEALGVITVRFGRDRVS